MRFLHIEESGLSIVFCDNKLIRRLNRRYLKRNTSTDVISFPLRDKFSPLLLGEVVISVEEAVKNAKIYGLEFPDEIVLYIIHGILHLLGYKDYRRKDAEKMEKKQKQIMALLHNSTRLGKSV